MVDTNAACESIKDLASLETEAKNDLLRVLRQAAAINTSDALTIIEHAIPPIVNYLLEIDCSGEDKIMVCIACQIVANVLARGPDTHTFFLSTSGCTSLLHLLVIATQVETRNGIAAIIACIHSIVTHQPSYTATLLGNQTHFTSATEFCFLLRFFSHLQLIATSSPSCSCLFSPKTSRHLI